MGSEDHIDSFKGARKQIEIYRQMTGAERLWIGCGLYEMAKKIVSAGARRMFPHLDESELEEKIKERMSRGTS
ncbi:MAG: hypothetical protein HY096_01695 [Nitrospinae bacterium]|nr:hypothetical protein [Nitrospinota bacterium]